MKRTLLLSSLFIFFPFVGPGPATEALAGPPSRSGGEGIHFISAEIAPAAGINVPGYLDAGSSVDNFADLDVRDSQNRSVTTPEAKANLASLFLDGLFNLTVKAPPHAILVAAASIEIFSRLLLKSFYDFVATPLKAIIAALGPGKKRFVHNVHNLWITLAVGFFIAACLLSLFFSPRTQLLSPIRC